MSSQQALKDFDKDSKFLGKQVGRKFAFLALSSCMEKGDRLNLAYTEAFRKMVNFYLENNKDLPKKERDELMEFLGYLKNVVEPTLTVIGFANWDRNELTDLSLRTALVRPLTVDFSDKKNDRKNDGEKKDDE